MPQVFVPNFKIFAKATPESVELTEDPETGNLIQVVSALEIKAWVEPNKDIKSGRTVVKPEDPSVDFNTVYLNGFCVEPKIIPSQTLVVRDRYDAIYIEPITGFEQRGKFILAPQVNAVRPRVAKAIARRLGTQFQGSFEFG